MSDSTIDVEMTPPEDETQITKFLLACQGEGEYKVSIDSQAGEFVIECIETGAKYTAYVSELLSKKQQLTAKALLQFGARDYSHIRAREA